MKTCPLCAEEIQDAAIKCKHCGGDVRGGAPAPARVARPAVERTLYETDLHWIVFARPAIWLVLAIFFGFVLGSTVVGPIFVAVFVMAAVGDVLGRFLLRRNTHFALTTQRLSLSTGVLRKRSLELILQKVEAITVNQPLLGRALSYGTLVVSGTGGTKEAFPLVTDPTQFRTRIQDAVAAQTRG